MSEEKFCVPIPPELPVGRYEMKFILLKKGPGSFAFSGESLVSCEATQPTPVPKPPPEPTPLWEWVAAGVVLFFGLWFSYVKMWEPPTVRHRHQEDPKFDDSDEE